MIPKKLKHRKHHRGHTKGKAMAGNAIAFGSYALKSMENSWVTARQIEAARRAMTRYIQRGGKIWIRVFSDKPVTVHGNESPMGGGKGAVDHFVAVVKKGKVLFEMDGVEQVLTGDLPAEAVAAQRRPDFRAGVARRQYHG